MLNNIFTKIRKSALKKVDDASIAAYNLFWENGIDFEQSHVDEEHIFHADPLLDEDFKLKPESPCIDAGTTQLRWKEETLLQLPRSAYVGLAPDLGAFERGR